MTAIAISEALGGRKTLRRSVQSEVDLHAATCDGLPTSTLTALAGKLSLDRKAVAKVVGISDRTLSRRLAHSLRLSTEESDRTMRLARIFAMAEDTLGASDKASRWLQKRNLALGGEVPLDLLNTDAGTRMVETILNRIEYGVYS